jgi:nitrous oxidase accessory protein NosD
MLKPPKWFFYFCDNSSKRRFILKRNYEISMKNRENFWRGNIKAFDSKYLPT